MTSGDEPDGGGDTVLDEVEAAMRRGGLTAAGSLSLRLTRPEVPADAHRSAMLLRREHSERARAVAGARLEAMLDADDEGGIAAWTDILYALGELERDPRDGEGGH